MDAALQTLSPEGSMAAPDADIHYRIGKLFGLYEGLQESVKKVEENQAQQSTKLDDIMQILSRADGGWKTFIIVGSCMAAVISAIAWLCDKLGIHMKMGG